MEASDAAAEFGTYTITIHNEARDVTVFPILATTANDADEWLQAAFGVPRDRIGELTYAHKFHYRMYVKPRAGIAPGERVVLTLPLCSQLAPAPDGTQPDEYIDWWNNGRLYLYAGPISAGAPAALTRSFDGDQPNLVTPLTPGPACAGCPLPHPPIFKDTTAPPAGDPALLLGYTLGAIDKGAVYKILGGFRIVDCNSLIPSSTANGLIGDAASAFRVVIG